jgi:hypothetical protein
MAAGPFVPTEAACITAVDGAFDRSCTIVGGPDFTYSIAFDWLFEIHVN